MALLLGLALCATLLLISSFFSAAETGLLSLPPQEMKRLAVRAPSLEKYIQAWLAKPQKLMITILVGNTLTDVAFASGLTFLALQTLSFWPERPVEMVAWVAGSVTTTILAEILPKLLGRKHPEMASHLALPVLPLFGKIFKPLLSIAETSLKPFLKSGTDKRGEKGVGFSAEDLMHVLIDSGRGLQISSECLDMMTRVLEIHKRTAKDIMTPPDKIEFIDWNRFETRTDEALDLFVETGHTRVPLKKNGSWIGYLHAKDILEATVKTDSKPLKIKSLIHPLARVNGDRPVGELLMEFQDQNITMALVTSKDHNTAGLITLEDILEEITGEILDEYDHNP